MTCVDSELLIQFEACTVDPAAFGHREHIQVAWEMLHKYNYLDACSIYAGSINQIATAAGAPEKFNVTITFAFLSLIAERVHAAKIDNFDQFLDSNPDLLSRDTLGQWYTREELASEFARTHFLLPSKAA